MTFPYAEKVSRAPRPLDWTEEKIAWMVAACREMAIFHADNCPEIRFLYKKNNFDPASIRTEADLTRIPSLGVTAMNYFCMTSLPHDKAVLKLTSSGTRGQKTQIWFDQESLDRVQGMMDVLWEQDGLVSSTPTNYANFIYDPEQAKDLGIAFSVKNEQRFASPKHSYFAVKKDGSGNWAFRAEETIEVLKTYIKEGSPVRLLGVPSFMFELLEKLQEQSLRLQLPANSWMLTGGGWKAAEDKKVTREKYRALVTEYLGLPDYFIRDGFGMAEHSAPYSECHHHKFHIPVYNRILVRNPETLGLCNAGQIGLLQFITPFNAMMPTLSILSTDLGYVNEKPCECGQNSPTFVIVGRGGLVKHKGCALTANEIVRRKA